MDNPDLGVQTFQQASAFLGGALDGQLAELLVVIGPTTDGDLDKLEAYFRSKYALP